MNLNKHLEFLTPAEYGNQIHIIGVGAIGSRIAEQAVRLGFSNIVIYDFDTVDDYNVTNQVYTHEDIGKVKTTALMEYLKKINPEVEITAFGKYTRQPLAGAVFLCVDSIQTRRKIVEDHFHNPNIDIMFDCRMRLTDAQAYAAIWDNEKQKTNFLNSMNFTDEDANEATPVSVCGTTLSVMPTVVTIVSLTIANFINFIKTKTIKNVILADPFACLLDAFTQKH